MENPHWEHGYRCHGYWLGMRRVGFIGLPPPSGRRVRSYSWSMDFPRDETAKGDATTLRAAKRAVEREYRARLAGP